MAADRVHPSRRCLRTALVLAALFPAACVDGPTSVGFTGELHVRPAFGAGDEPAAIGLTVDSVQVLVERTQGDDRLVDTTLAYVSDSTAVGWLLALTAEEETVRVEMTLWDEGLRAYQGERTATVRDGALATAMIEPVPVAYVGPAVVDTVLVMPDALTLALAGETAMLEAEARDRHGAVVGDAEITWSSAAPGVATVDPVSGLVTAVSGGSATITATSGSASGTATVTVLASADVASVVVTPASARLTAAGETLQFTAEAFDAAGGVVPGIAFAWSTGAATIATIGDGTGLATAVGHGVTTVIAGVGGISGTAELEVALRPSVASITVTPGDATLVELGSTRQFTAVAHDASGEVIPDVVFVWQSTVPGAATIDTATGLATAVAHGSTGITATADGVVGSATLDVDLSAEIRTIAVTPDSAGLTALGASRLFTAVARDASGLVVPVATFAWSSDRETVATVDAGTGVATAVGHGVATIAATAGGRTGTATLVVELSALVATVTVTPGEIELPKLGATTVFIAEARDAAGTLVPGVPFAWSLADTLVATIDRDAGVATARANGTTLVTASTGTVAGTAVLHVVQRVDHVVVTPATATLEGVGATRQFTAEAFDGNGHVIPGVSFAWYTQDSAIATIDATGLARAVALGSTTIKAYFDSVRGTAVLTVH